MLPYLANGAARSGRTRSRRRGCGGAGGLASRAIRRAGTRQDRAAYRKEAGPRAQPSSVSRFEQRRRDGSMTQERSSEVWSSEVVGRHVVGERREALDPGRANRDDAVLLLHDSLHEEERLGHQRQAMAREALWRHDHVRDTRLVLQGEEDEPLGGPRALANDDAARHPD